MHPNNPLASSPLISVVIPVFNEARTLERIVGRIVETNQDFDLELILVDDCSTDRSFEIAQQLVVRFSEINIQLKRLEKNSGKGAALRAGFQNVAGQIVIIQDADLEYDPAEYSKLIAPILADEADVVYGSRFLDGKKTGWHATANRTLTKLSNVFSRLSLTDMETCFKVFRREVIQEIGPQLEQNRFGFEPEITAKIARRKYRLIEISISYSPRTYAEGKKIRWLDGVKAVWCIVRYGCFH